MNTDIYMKIASEMDDKDILSMLSVNKKFNNPKFSDKSWCSDIHY